MRHASGQGLTASVRDGVPNTCFGQPRASPNATDSKYTLAIRTANRPCRGPSGAHRPNARGGPHRRERGHPAGRPPPEPDEAAFHAVSIGLESDLMEQLTVQDGGLYVRR